VYDEHSRWPAADLYVLLGDLPRILGQDESSPLSEIPLADSTTIAEFDRWIAVYWPAVPPSLELRPLPTALHDASERLVTLGPPPYIGVTWRAGTIPEEQRSGNWVLFKEIDIAALGKTLSATAGTLLALQRQPRAGEIETLSAMAGRPVHDLTMLNDDLESMLALLAVIDDYVGVSNTNMHLRAAARRKARVLVPTPAEWRWMHAGRASPWFPGFDIYRQSVRGDWTAALAALRHDLTANFPAGV
jgi:hypothetical protein